MRGEALHLGYQQPGRLTGRCIGKPGAVLLLFLFFRCLFGNRWELGVLLLHDLREVPFLRFRGFAKPGIIHGPK